LKATARSAFILKSSAEVQNLVCPPDNPERLFLATRVLGPEAANRRQPFATERGLPMTRRPEIQFTPDEQAAFLSQPHKAALATIDKEGFLHVVAMGHRYKDGVIYMISY
jgi:hypothetical protein